MLWQSLALFIATRKMISNMHDSQQQQRKEYSELLVDFYRGLCPKDLFFSDNNVTPMFYVDDLGDDLITVSYRAADLDQRMLDVIYGFRLAEFVARGMMSATLAERTALVKEPDDGTEVHVLTFDMTGRLVGYIGLLGLNIYGSGLQLDDPDRPLFPVEVAHGVELLSKFSAPHIDTSNVYEIKRFIRAGNISDRKIRDRIPWHLLLGLGRTVTDQLTNLKLVVGDGRKNGTLQHLKLLGFVPMVVEGTFPKLSEDSLMAPSYDVLDPAVPFVSWLPNNFLEKLTLLEDFLGRPQSGNWQLDIIKSLAET